MTSEVIVDNEFVAGIYLEDLNAVLYMIDPHDGTDEVICLLGKWRERVPREELLELLEAESV